jgi:hypothetical protein
MADSPGKIDLYRVSLNDMTKRELLLNDIFEVGRMVFDNGNFIACTISGADGDGPMSAVYNVRTKQFKTTGKAEVSSVPIYFPNTKSLRYLNTHTNTFSKMVNYK